MTVSASTISSPIELTKYRLVERVVYEGHVLSVVLRAMPENVAWEIKFSGVVGFRVFDERDLLKYWPVCSGEALFQIHEGGWLAEAKQSADHLNSGFYGEVAEYLVAGEDSCVNVISSELPTVVECG